jgi:hypothetical protein
MKQALIIMAVLVIAATLYAQAPVRFNTQTLYYNNSRSTWQVGDRKDTISLITHQTVWLPAIDTWNGYASISANFIIGTGDSIWVYSAISNYPAAMTPSGTADTVGYKLNKADSILVTAAAVKRKSFSFAGNFGKSVVLWVYNESSTASALSRLAAAVQ